MSFEEDITVELPAVDPMQPVESSVASLRRPEREVVTLMNSKGHWTRHTFSHAELVKVERARGGFDMAHAFMFRCTQTGVIRQFGLEA